MKHIIITLLIGTVLLTSCEHPMTLETDVHEDGSLDKTITFENGDSVIFNYNMFAINAAKGWSVETVPLPVSKTESGNDKVEYKISFKKHFSSVDDVNNELNAAPDSVFKIKSTFEKRFRWFYTYIRYSETYLPINRFKKLSEEDYLNAEDHQFIERLPGEGKHISKADSLYLQMLNVKINDYYANMAIFNEEYEILTELVRRSNLDKRWMDTVAHKREYIYNHVDKMRGEPEFALMIADSLHIPLQHDNARKDLKVLAKDLNSRIAFMGYANDGKYKNIINMPWTIVNSNADSVAGNKLFWRPLVTKFLFNEYEMYAESRKPNVWAMIVSAVVVVLTILLLIRKSK